MKITFLQEARLEEKAHVLESAPNYPYGENCPACKRPRVSWWSDGSRVCDKCDEVVVFGEVLRVEEPMEAE